MKVLLALLTGGVNLVLSVVVRLVLSFAAAFFTMFFGLSVVCWVTGNDAYMVLMYLGIVLVPVGGLLIFAVSGIWALARRNAG
ncbi:MAG: hypothetical protein WCI73_05665 [Phycisphaerae bacterium]